MVQIEEQSSQSYIFQIQEVRGTVEPGVSFGKVAAVGMTSWEQRDLGLMLLLQNLIIAIIGFSTKDPSL